MTDDISMVSADDRDWNPHTSARIYAEGDVSVVELSCGCIIRYSELPEGSCSCGAFTFERVRPPEFDLEIEYDRYGVLKYAKRVPIEYKPLPPKRRHKR